MMARNLGSAAEIARWDLPSVSGTSVQARRAGPTVSELEAIEKKAHDEAYAEGHAAGLAAAKAQMQPSIALRVAQANLLHGVRIPTRSTPHAIAETEPAQ